MRHTLIAIVFLASLTAVAAFSEEVIIWHDAEGNPHAAKSIDEIPEQFRPKPPSVPAFGVLTSLKPEQVQAALAEGKAQAANPEEYYRPGLGLYRRFTYTLNGVDGEAYLFIGTKYALIKARAAVAAGKGLEVPMEYIDKVLAQGRLYIAFFGPDFVPAVVLLRQEDTVIKGEDGFGDVNPGLTSARMTKSFPYDAIDFTKPAEVEVFNLEGNSIEFEVDWGGVK